MLGRTLSHYRIVAPLGAGGMGVVYRAHDLHLERDVALKVLPEGALADEAARKRFRREALALSRLNHPHIATVHDFDTQDHVDFLIMELVEGCSLSERLTSGPLPEAEVVAIGVQIAEALEAAHEKGVLHRDLKPANIVVSGRDRVKLLDFGLARLLRPAGAQDLTRSMTEPEVVVGTLPYMAPEQLLARRVDARADLYALGVVLYEMATGRLPYREKVSTALVYEIVHRPVPPPRQIHAEVSERLEAIILRCLEKDPERRPASARELAADLRDPGRTIAPPVSREPSRARRRGVIAAGVVLAVAALMAIVFAFDVGHLRGRWPLAAGAAPIRALAVLPLENLARDSTQDFFVDGMTDELITRLAQIGALTVISRASVMRYRGTTKALREIARELKVDALITGSVLRSGNQARIAAQLVRGATGENLWADSYEGELSEVIALQNRVARSITEKIRVKVSARERASLESAPTVNAEAHELYLKGRYYWSKFPDTNAQKLAIVLFKQALDKDPTYAPAYAGISDAYYDMSDLSLAPRVAIPLARSAALKALELDESLAEAHVSLGVVKNVFDWDWAGAEREFKRAIELNPNYALAHLRYGQFLIYSGRTDEAGTELNRTLALDPMLHGYYITSLWPYYYTRPAARRPDLLIARLREFIAADPSFSPAHTFLGMAWALKHDYARALAEFGTGEAGGTQPYVLACRGAVLALEGRPREAEQTIRDLVAMSETTFVSPCGVAAVHTALGHNDEAFRWLAKAYDVHSEWLIYLKVDPFFDGLRSDPRYADLVRRLGLSS